MRALTDPAVRGGEYYAPTGHLRGDAVTVPTLARTATPEGDLADRVWRQIEVLAGVQLSGLAPVADAA